MSTYAVQRRVTKHWATEETVEGREAADVRLAAYRAGYPRRVFRVAYVDPNGFVDALDDPEAVL